MNHCSWCGKVLEVEGVMYPDLEEWGKAYGEAKAKGIPAPEFPPAKTACCGAPPIWPPAPDIGLEGPPPLELGARRVGGFDFGAMIRLCNDIGKSPNSIKAFLRLDVVPDLFGPRAYYIDVKARGIKEKIEQIMGPGISQIEESTQ